MVLHSYPTLSGAVHMLNSGQGICVGCAWKNNKHTVDVKPDGTGHNDGTSVVQI